MTDDSLKQAWSWMLLLKNRDSMTADYRNTIKHTGGLLTSSMAYAYSKGINDAMKLIQKEIIKNEKSVQSEQEEGKVPDTTSAETAT